MLYIGSLIFYSVKLGHEHHDTSATRISMQIYSSTAPLSASSDLVLKFPASSGAERFANCVVRLVNGG